MAKKEGFEITFDDVPVENEDNKEKEVKVEVKTEVAEVKETKKEKEAVIVEQEEDGLITVDTGPPKEKEVEKEKEPEKQEETEDKSKIGEEVKKPEETESPSLLHATALKVKGLLPHLDIESLKEKTDEEIIQATIDGTQEEIEATVASIVEQQDAAYQQFLEVLNSGGDLDEYVRIKASQKRFDGITDDSLEDNTDVSKALITEDMKNRGFDDAEILDTIEELEEKEKLTTRAKPALKRLKKRDEDREAKLLQDSKDAEETQKKQRVETMKKIDTTLGGVKEIIPGIPVTARDKQTMKKLMTVPAETKDGVAISRAQQIRSEDPISYETKLAYYIGIGLFDKTPNWEKVIKRATTDVTKKIMAKVKDTSKHTPGKPPARQVKTDDEELIMPFSST